MRNHLKLDRFLDPPTRQAFHALIDEPATTVPLAFEWLRDRGIAIGFNAVYAYLRRRNPRRVTHNRVLKLDKVLKPRDRRAYTAFVRNPAHNLADAREWLAKRGYRASLSSIRLHRRRILNEFDEVRHAARLGVALAEAAAEAGVEVFKSGTLTRVDQLAMEHVFNLRKSQTITARELTEWVKLVESSVGAHDKLQTLAEKMEAKLLKESAPESGPSANPHAEVADRLRRLLGVTPEAAARGLPSPSPGTPGEGRGEGSSGMTETARIPVGPTEAAPGS